MLVHNFWCTNLWHKNFIKNFLAQNSQRKIIWLKKLRKFDSFAARNGIFEARSEVELCYKNKQKNENLLSAR